ncbi:MAG: tetratricopeptide repeat protein, partial [Planctomycetota bacterium]
LERLIQAGPEAGQALEDRYLLSLSYEGLERHQEALEALTPVVESGAGRLRAEAQLTRASLLMKLKRFEEAIAPLEASLQRWRGMASDPTADGAAACLGNLAICHAEVRQLDKARQRYAELLDHHAGHELVAPTTEQLAQAVYDAGDLAWAETLFTQLADDGQPAGRRLEGLSGLAWSQHKAGQLEKAAQTFDRVLQGNPDPPLAAETALARGRILQQLGEPDPALAMYDMVIDRWKDTEQYPEALWAAALLRDSLEQDREAAEQYERLATAYPKFRKIDALLYNWAWTLDDLKRPEESSALFGRLRGEHPTSSYWADATFRLAQRSFEAKDYERARQLLSELLAAEATGQIRENTLYLQGQVATAEQQWDQARRAFQTLLDEYPESALRLTAEYGIAEATFRKSGYREAGELLERVDRLLLQVREKDQPWMGVVPLRLAQALCHQKRWDEAYQIASTISDEYPDFEEQYEVDYVIGRCLASRAEFELARQAYRKVIQSPQGAKTETAAKAQLMIAESYYHQEDYPQALREYLALEILYAYPAWQATAVFQAAKCHEMLGEWKQAVDEYARLLADYPDTSFTKEATQRLRAARQRLAAEPTT